MAGNVGFSFLIDRASGVFDISADYTVPGYDDPETSEAFYETNWSISYSDPVYTSGTGTSGPGWDSGTGFISLGFPEGEAPTDARLEFNASNWFSGVSAFATLHIRNAGLATAVVTLTAAPADGDSVLIGGAGDDTLTGASGNDLLDGGGGADVLVGGGGKDILEGGSGGDAMAGGASDDTYYVDDGGDAIAEAEDGGTDLVFSAVSTTLAANLEDLILFDPAAVSGTGNASANTIYGNNGANTLYGLDGDDVLVGYDGTDDLVGGQGRDRLDGGLGADRLIGGADDDVYLVDSLGDRVIEASGGGRDEVRVDGLDRFALAAHVENLVNLAARPVFSGKGNGLANALTGAAGTDRLYGRGGDDVLDGGAGNDLLDGGAGADRLVGAAGIDTASYASALAAVTADLGGGPGAGDAAGDTFSDIENVIGSGLADTLTGTTGANRLSGGAGDDRLDGGGGLDWLVGGSGADRLVGDGNDGASYAGSAAGVTVDLAAQTASGAEADGDVLSGIARVEGSAHGDTLLGDAAANLLLGRNGSDVIDGAGGNDVIRGGAGADELEGGAGVDTLDYTGSAAGVTIDFANAAASGGDAAGDTFSGFERVLGSAQDDVLIADDLGRQLGGGAGADRLTGGAGRDVLVGGAGADVMEGGAGSDTLSYATSRAYVSVNLATGQVFGEDAQGDTFSGIENLTGGQASDALYGDAARNVISGGGGGDYIDGAGGNDVLAGGTGDDAYLVNAESGFDRIRDFTAGGTEDRLIFDLGPLFATFDQVMAAAVQRGEDTVITFASGNGLVLEGVDRADLTTVDFVF